MHVWTYAVGLHQFLIPNDNAIATCLSTGGGAGPWDFVGDNYFCSSGSPDRHWSPKLYTTPLWSNIRGECSMTFCGEKLMISISVWSLEPRQPKIWSSASVLMSSCLMKIFASSQLTSTLGNCND